MATKHGVGCGSRFGMLHRRARIAGLLYTIVIPLGFFDLMYLPDRFLHSADPVATARAISADQFLFRVAIATDLVTGVVWLAVVLALYRLLRDVDRVQAELMVILGALLQVPLYFVSAAQYAGAFVAATDKSFTAFSELQRGAIAVLFLRLHNYEIVVSLVFAGLWLLPFGVLVYKSAFLPRTLGVWLIAECFAWLAVSFGDILAPQYSRAISTITMPLTLAEVAIALWLLILGARTLGRPRHRSPGTLTAGT
jgi:Domain of unknown function (DUF4386)